MLPGPIEAGPDVFLGTVVASDQDLLLHAGPLETTLRDGTGHATVIGAVDPGQYAGVAPGSGSLSVSGGTGSVTVWGGNEGGAIYGGTAGNNVLVGGAALTGYTASNPTILFGPGGALLDNPGGMTIGGGGNGDLLVASGTLDNVLAAAAGNETMTGSGATGDNLFHVSATPGAWHGVRSLLVSEPRPASWPAASPACPPPRHPAAVEWTTQAGAAASISHQPT